jgi:membrane protease YdiL (CAAX protease family)
MEGFPQRQWRLDAAWTIAVIAAGAVLGVGAVKQVGMEFAGGEPAPADPSRLFRAEALLQFIVPALVVGSGLLLAYAVAMGAGFEIFPRAKLRPVTWTVWHVAKAGAATILGGGALVIAAGYLLGMEADDARLRVAAAYVAHVFFMVLAMWFVVGTRGGPKAMGLTLEGWPGGLVHGVVGYVAAFPILCLSVVIATTIAALLRLRPQLPEFLPPMSGAESPWLAGAVVFLITILGPLTEEVFFRGFLYPAMRRRLSAAPAIVINGILFGLIHMSVARLVPLAVLGMIMAWLFEKTRSLVAPATLHALHNALQLLLIYHLYGSA